MIWVRSSRRHQTNGYGRPFQPDSWCRGPNWTAAATHRPNLHNLVFVSSQIYCHSSFQDWPQNGCCRLRPTNARLWKRFTIYRRNNTHSTSSTSWSLTFRVTGHSTVWFEPAVDGNCELLWVRVGALYLHKSDPHCHHHLCHHQSLLLFFTLDLKHTSSSSLFHRRLHHRWVSVDWSHGLLAGPFFCSSVLF